MAIDYVTQKQEYREPTVAGLLLLLSSFGGKEKGMQRLEAQSKPE